MKSFVKANIPYVFFVILWFLYNREFFNGNVSAVKPLVFIISFVLSLVPIGFIKKKQLSILPGLIVAVAVSIYNIEYLFFYLPVYLIIFIYLNIINTGDEKRPVKPHKDTFHDSLMVILINSMVIIVIFALVKLFNYPDNQLGVIERTVSYHSVMITVFLIIFYVFGRSKRNKNRESKDIEKKISKAKNNLNIICLAMFSVQLFAYYASAYHNDGNFRIMFFPWFLYILIVVYNDDSIFNRFIIDAEKKIERFVNSKG